MLLGRLAAALALALTGAVAEELEQESELRQLNEDNFKATIAHGAWLVEHFSPRCWHCKAFAPTWAELAEKKAYHEQLSGFHMAQVNCLAQGDLCNSNNIRGYPSLMLYADGKEIGEYKLDRAYPILAGWIEEKALAYARNEPLGEKTTTDEEEEEPPSPQRHRPNPEGKVVETDDAGLEQLKADGPVFVDFFAPWCSHCKKLRPQYEKLAKAYKGTLNIVAVNCDDHPMVCKRNGVTGYPTIKLFQDGEAKVFEKHRTVDLMTKFLDEEVKHVPMQRIMSEDFEEIVASNDIFFVYVTNYGTSMEEMEQVKKAVKPLGLSVPVYQTNDPLFYRNQSIANPPPTSALLAFSSNEPDHIGSVILPAKDEDLARFVRRNRYPSFFDLSGDNYKSIFQAEDTPLVVLGAIQDAEGTERREMIKMANAWKKDGRPFEQRVLFVAANAGHWDKWLRKMVSITPIDIPGLVVIDTATREYYDTTIEGERARFKGADAFSILEGIFQKFLTSKKIESGLEWGSRSGALMLFEAGQWGAKHPILAIMGVLGAVVAFVYALSRCMSRRPSHPSGYLNEKGGQRLD